MEVVTSEVGEVFVLEQGAEAEEGEVEQVEGKADCEEGESGRDVQGCAAVL